jgi:hypothetical protein
MAAEPTSQPTPEEQRLQQAAGPRGDTAPGRETDDVAMDSAMGGADDANSGGGNATGIPDGETAMRTDAVTRGNVRQDRDKVFPKSDQPQEGADNDRTRSD